MYPEIQAAVVRRAHNVRRYRNSSFTKIRHKTKVVTEPYSSDYDKCLDRAEAGYERNFITGSPHKKGASALLADEFIRDAQKSGWDTYRYKLTGGKKVFLLAAAYDRNDWTMEALKVHYQPLVRYLKWTDSGMALPVGCGVRSDIERSQFPQEAYQLGFSLK